jgi:hypothetical protein
MNQSDGALLWSSGIVERIYGVSCNNSMFGFAVLFLVVEVLSSGTLDLLDGSCTHNFWAVSIISQTGRQTGRQAGRQADSMMTTKSFIK